MIKVIYFKNLSAVNENCLSSVLESMGISDYSFNISERSVTVNTKLSDDEILSILEAKGFIADGVASGI